MADVAFASDTVGNAPRITWETLTSANAAGTAFLQAGTSMAVAAVQFTGTFGGATAVLQGSNDGVEYATLRDPQTGTAISFTGADYAEVGTGMAFIRPFTSGGDGTQDIDCILVARG